MKPRAWRQNSSEQNSDDNVTRAELGDVLEVLKLVVCVLQTRAVKIQLTLQSFFPCDKESPRHSKQSRDLAHISKPRKRQKFNLQKKQSF